MRGSRRHHHEPPYGALSVALEGTAPSGGWIRRRSRRATERRRAEERRIELYLNGNFCFSDQHYKLSGASSFLGMGKRGSIGMECQREQVRRSGPSGLRR